jgi:acyl-CoA reductase-like NAD-dependent aldehyde dehydrogenase
MHFASRLKSGIIHINDQTVADQPWVPFGQWWPAWRRSKLGGVHPVAVGDDPGPGDAVSVLRLARPRTRRAR